MTRRKTRSFLLLATVAAAACGTGCELLVSFDRSLIDGGVEADAGASDAQVTDATTDQSSTTDASDSGSTDAKPDVTDAGEHEAGDAGDAGDAGCTSSSHCPVGEACDTTTGTCTTTCSTSQTCNGVCCNGTTCAPGDAAAACGLAGAMCSDCITADAGAVCIAATGTCGCNSELDCPVAQSCNVVTHACTSSCTGSQVCHGTCCSGSTCAAESPTSCGPAGGTCANCVALDAGSVCVDLPDGGAGMCGCTQTSECPTGYACDTSQHACTTACSTSQACNGGCCSAADGGMCQGGTQPAECGNSGICASCTGNASGTACIQGTCGCSSTANCACGQSGSDAGACACIGSPVGACADTEVLSFSASPSTINVGQSAQLSWSSADGVSCSISPGVGSVACQSGGSPLTVTPSSDTAYALTVMGDGGTTVANASVTLNKTAFCGALVAASEPAAPAIDSTAALPAFTGGTLVDGTYVLTADTLYGAADNNPTGNTNTIVVVLSNSASGTSTMTFDQIQNASEGGTDNPAGGTLSPITATTTMTINITCGGNTGTGTIGYSVSATSPLTFTIQAAPGSNETWTFTKQP